MQQHLKYFIENAAIIQETFKKSPQNTKDIKKFLQVDDVETCEAIARAMNATKTDERQRSPPYNLRSSDKRQRTE